MAELKFDEALAFRDLEVSSTDELFDVVGGALRDAEYAKDSYPQALKERESQYPTGLNVSGGVAIPHTDASHVLKNTIAVATLAKPVTFNEMGGAEDDTVEVSTVFMLALTDGKAHLKVLSKLIRQIQKEAFVKAIQDADSSGEIMDILSRTLSE